MSGINHLYDIYNKKGIDFIDELFNSFVTVNEKMDGSSFTFEKDKSGGFKFFKRDQRSPITMVDRTLMKYYEKPIQYIESLPQDVIDRIPVGWRFGTEYFSNTSPVEIAYDRLPKNNMILSYVHVKGPDGKIERSIQDKDKLDTWADLLGIDHPPIIFQGYLNADQKIAILDFVNTPFDELIREFKTKSFVRYIISILNPKATDTALNNDLDKPIEGVVFRFGEDEEGKEPIIAKMVDPVFTEIAKKKANERVAKKPSDILALTILDVMNFILEKGVKSFQFSGKNEDEKYVSFIGNVFTKFLDQYSDRYEGMDFSEPDYLKKDEFRLNKDLIHSRAVLKWLEQDESFESLFKLILNSFRKIRKRPGGVITSNMMGQFNLLVKDIEKYLGLQKKEEVIEESEFSDFLSFRKQFIPEKVEYVTEEEEEEESDDQSFDKFVSALETAQSSEPEDTKKVEEITQSKEKSTEKPKNVNMVIGRFQPFHNGHLKMIKTLKESNDLPCVVCVVHPGHNRSGKSPFSMETQKQMFSHLAESYPEICDVVFCKNGFLGSSLNAVKDKGYEPECIGCGDDRKVDFEKQLDYLRKNGETESIPKGFKIVETPRSTSGTKVRELIQNGDYSAFKKKVPSAVASHFYEKFRNELFPKDI